jgi:methyltransferase
VLRARGAVEPPGDVYRTMRWAYPGSFVMIALEGAIRGPSPRGVLVGVTMLAVAKALKYWAIATLGIRWTFRVLVLPEAPLRAGPYRLMRHPNYLAICGEILGVGLIVGAWVTAPIALIGFGTLLARRVRLEERMLGLR